MSAKKNELKTAWTAQEIDELLLHYFKETLAAGSEESVDVAVAFAYFMAKKTLTPDNYPIFFLLTKTGNHWIADALFGAAQPAGLFCEVQPNSYMLKEAVEIMHARRPRELYDKVLLALLEILKTAYEDPSTGFRLFELTANDVNQIGKHLAADKDPAESVNAAILHILDRIASLHAPGGLPIANKETEKACIQANNIRGKFLDPSKRLSEAIPEKLLAPGDNKKSEVAPRRMK